MRALFLACDKEEKKWFSMAPNMIDGDKFRNDVKGWFVCPLVRSPDSKANKVSGKLIMAWQYPTSLAWNKDLYRDWLIAGADGRNNWDGKCSSQWYCMERLRTGSLLCPVILGCYCIVAMSEASSVLHLRGSMMVHNSNFETDQLTVIGRLLNLGFRAFP